MWTDSDRGGVMCGSFMLGFVVLAVGLSFTFTMPPLNSTFEIISSLILMSGVLLVLAGIALIPSFRRDAEKLGSILEIIDDREIVIISEISSETGLDREYVKNRILNQLKHGFLFGHLEGDLFVHDTSRHFGRRRKKSDMSEAAD
jgi:hypothetical protein